MSVDDLAVLAIPAVLVTGLVLLGLGLDGRARKGGGMSERELTAERLAELLRAAERAHGDYERELGRRHDDWPTWYAQFIVDRLREER